MVSKVEGLPVFKFKEEKRTFAEVEREKVDFFSNIKGLPFASLSSTSRPSSTARRRRSETPLPRCRHHRCFLCRVPRTLVVAATRAKLVPITEAVGLAYLHAANRYTPRVTGAMLLQRCTCARVVRARPL
jgi:hypothetical protein